MICEWAGETDTRKWSDAQFAAEIEKQMGRPVEFDKVHVDNIRWNDTVLHNGMVRTVGKDQIKYGGFMGSSLRGDSYMSGRIPVIRLRLQH